MADTDMVARLDELESRYTLLEQSVNELSEVVTGQWRLIEAQAHKLERLQSALESQPQEAPADSKPPHY